jgi:hypothetical protein
MPPDAVGTEPAESDALHAQTRGDLRHEQPNCGPVAGTRESRHLPVHCALCTLLAANSALRSVVELHADGRTVVPN